MIKFDKRVLDNIDFFVASFLQVNKEMHFGIIEDTISNQLTEGVPSNDILLEILEIKNNLIDVIDITTIYNEKENNFENLDYSIINDIVELLQIFLDNYIQEYLGEEDDVLIEGLISYTLKNLNYKKLAINAMHIVFKNKNEQEIKNLIKYIVIENEKMYVED